MTRIVSAHLCAAEVLWPLSTRVQPVLEIPRQRGLNRERNRIERVFSKLKHVRRVATRSHRLDENVLAMIQFASMRLRTCA